MSTDGRDAADGLADTRDQGPQGEVSPPSDPLADTEAGFADLPSSDDPLRDLAERAAVRAKLFGTSRSDDALTIGRYAILKVLGEGGMGTVYACFDDKLDRRLALKVLKGPESEAARKRMLREAQAMAKLSHPNVVPVFEVGEHDGQLFVAMEYVKGMTLARWQSEEDRDWREVFEKYLQAGRGLAAAHAEGLVHRDFKPHNAVVGTDGRVRVLDFGLAAKHGEKDITASYSTVMPPAKDAALDTPLTETGTVMGTPAYMPPEQFMSGTVDARSDQFSFCVALWEGLYGVRPFDGKNATELFTKIAQGSLVAPKGTEVPAAVREVLERGLRSSAEERWPDLASLLGELERTVGVTRRRSGTSLALLATVALAVGVVGFLGWRQLQDKEAELVASTRVAEEQAELLREGAQASQEAEAAKAEVVKERNARLIRVARELEDAPNEAAVVLREVQGADLGNVPGWRATSQRTRARPRTLRAVLPVHPALVKSASFSPDGTRIVTTAHNSTVRVWNADGSGSPTPLKGHTDVVESASFSPDGTRILTTSRDDTARVWKSDGSGSPVVLKDHTGDVTLASFSPDGTRVLTASTDKTARVWNADGSGSPVILDEHTDVIEVASFSPDGTHILTASRDKTARVWNADGTGSAVVLGDHPGPVVSANFNPSGTRVVTAFGSKNAWVWNVDGSGAPRVLKGHTDRVASASFSPDGTRIVTASEDKTARVWNADGSGSALVLEGHSAGVDLAAFSPDGTRMLTLSSHTTARVWDADGSGFPLVLKGPPSHPGFFSARFSPNGKRIVTTAKDRTVRVWDAEPPRDPLIVVLKGHTDEVLSASFSPDGTRILTSTADGTAWVWNADGRGEPKVLEGPTTGFGWLGGFSPDGTRIMTIATGGVRIWSADGHGKPTLLEGRYGKDLWTSFGPSGARIVTASTEGVRLWTPDGRGKPTVLDADRVRWATFSPDGSRVITLSKDMAVVQVWNAGDRGKPTVLEGHTDKVLWAVFSLDGAHILTGCDDGIVRVWKAGGAGAPVELAGHTPPVMGASVSPDGTRILTRDLQKARVWNADGTGTPVELKGHVASGFSPDGTRILTASREDNTARVWNADGSGPTGLLEGHTGRIHSVSFSPDGTRVVTASEDETARVWSLADSDGESHADFVGESRTVFWQTPLCHTPEVRRELLGETEALAQARYDRCRELTSICSREDYETCHEAVTKAFASPPPTG